MWDINAKSEHVVGASASPSPKWHYVSSFFCETSIFASIPPSPLHIKNPTFALDECHIKFYDQSHFKNIIKNKVIFYSNLND